MKPSKKSIWLTFAILIAFSLMGFSQKSESGDSSKEELKTAAREIMKDAHNCALVTLDKDGNPGVRTMEPFDPEEDFTIWLGTSPKSRKVRQIKDNPNVALYYADPDKSGYVVMHGKAQMVNDDAEKQKRWKEEWGSFYPDKSADFILIKVSPVRMEVISYSRGIVGDATTWDPPEVRFESK
jgi:general stress protein 26